MCHTKLKIFIYFLPNKTKKFSFALFPQKLRFYAIWERIIFAFRTGSSPFFKLKKNTMFLIILIIKYR